MKEAGMRIRIETELREQFMAACRCQDVPAAQVIRTFIKGYVQQSQGMADIAVKSRKKPTKTTTVTK